MSSPGRAARAVTIVGLVVAAVGLGLSIFKLDSLLFANRNPLAFAYGADYAMYTATVALADVAAYVTLAAFCFGLRREAPWTRRAAPWLGGYLVVSNIIHPVVAYWITVRPRLRDLALSAPGLETPPLVVVGTVALALLPFAILVFLGIALIRLGRRVPPPAPVRPPPRVSRAPLSAPLPAGPSLYPCLKDAGWAGRGDSVRRLLWEGASSPYMPWVGFGYDHPHTFEFLPLARERRTMAEIEAEALGHLRRRSASWQPVSVELDGGGTADLLVCSDDFLAAERILDPAFLREAQRRLGAHGLLVGAPRRERLLAMNGEADPAAVAAFAGFVAMQYHKAPSAPIAPLVFGMKDGRFIGLLDAAVDVGRAPSGDDAEPDSDAPHVQVVVLQGAEPDREDIEILAGGPDFDALSNGIVSALAETLARHLRRPEFSGRIKVVILAHTPPEARTRLPELAAHLRGLAAESGVTSSGRRVEIVVDEASRSSWN